MKTLQRTLTAAVFAVLCLSTAAAAQVTFSGDARFRPRIDLDDRPESNYKRSQFYVMYRLRLNMTAAIGDGFYVKSRLAHNGIGFYQKGGEGKLPDIFGNDANGVSDESAARPELDLLYMYIGRATDTYGYDLGIVPVPGFSNPLFDLHYYPNLMIDVPYFIWNNDGAFGAKGYVDVGPGRLNVYGLLDRERIESNETQDGTTTIDGGDQYTFVAAYTIPAGGITIEPTIMKTFGAQQTTYDPVLDVETVVDYNAPFTVGANVTFPKFEGLTPAATFGYTTNSEADTQDSPASEYTGWLGRFKLSGPLGPGTLLAWVDLASRTDELTAGDVSNDYMYSWLAYSIPIYDGEHGSFRITPEWRFINYDQEDSDMRTRNKLEINFDASFR